MDVQCERCKAEYSFNDALVSVRGTPVRCTSCGHQFKVYRASAESDAPGEQWLVKTASGLEQSFPTFRELQNAILGRRVRREDALLREGSPAQPLSSISELEPLFERAAGASVSDAPPQSEGFAPVPSSRAPAAVSLRPDDGGASPPSSRGGTITGASIPPRGKIETLRPPPTGVAAPPPSSPSVSSTADESDAREFEAIFAPRATLAAVDTPAAPPSPEPDFDRGARVIAPPRPLWRSQLPSDDELPQLRSLSPASEETYSTAPRRRMGGWVVALALVLAVGVVGWTAVKPYLVARSAGASVQLNPRAQAFVADGEKAMADGDLEIAQENFDKASALAEDDAHVLLDEARLAAAKADVPWLKIRLLPADARDELRTAKAALDELSARGRHAAEKARASAPDDVASLRAEVDALRIAGDLGTARGEVPKVVAQASQPETAYVLAALDLAEPEPVWATVIERLRLAAAGEGNAGRARAALVYALARSGDAPAANAELAKIDSFARPYPLLPNLAAFVGKASAKPAPSVAATVSAPSPSTASPARRVAASAEGSGETPADDSSASMQAAATAIKKGDFARAGQIYQALATRNPNDSEALSGLGDVARSTANPSGAIAAYRRAIGVNPSYLPALLGLADTEWSLGDRAAATHAYGDIVDRFPEGTYPPYVTKRVNAAAPSAAAPSPANGAGGNPSPASDEHHE